MSELSPLYAGKQAAYFSGVVRRRFIEDLPPNLSARLLDIGCGSGANAAYALAEGKCGWCCGVELCEAPATEAATKLNRVIVGNIEDMELDLPPGSIDVLIMSEVLEHLIDPASVLLRLKRLLIPGALVAAGSPNACHHGIVRMLLRGEWEYQPSGVLDQTHLRWFTAKSFRRLFESCGFVVDFVGAAASLGPKSKLANRLLFGRFDHLFYPQIYLRAHLA